MKFRYIAIAALVATAAAFAIPVLAAARRGPKRLLVVTVTKGFRHGDSIDAGGRIIREMGEQSRAFVVDYVRTDAEMATKMTAQGLKNYDGVLFLNTTGDLPLPDKAAFYRWVAAGHGFVGIHAATDTLHGDKEYLSLIGAEFKTHGPQVEVDCIVQDTNHPATQMLGSDFTIYDEIYQFHHYDSSRFHELIVLDRHPNDKTPGYYPLAWCRNEGRGRVFYTALGHRVEVWNTPLYQAHLLGGIRWMLGLEKGDSDNTPTAQAHKG